MQYHTATLGWASLGRECWNLIGAPLRLLLLADEPLRRLRLRTKQDERIRFLLPRVRGRLLDVGAGTNALVRVYGNGVGVDIRDWGGGALVIEDAASLPFETGGFDTVTFAACLNHIPNRVPALREAHRVLAPDGRVLITMIHPFLGSIGHRFWWYGGEPHRLEHDHELPGMTTRQITPLVEEAGFALVDHRRFVYGLNHFYMAEKTS